MKKYLKKAKRRRRRIMETQIFISPCKNTLNLQKQKSL
jgi:hypothetical protein